MSETMQTLLSLALGPVIFASGYALPFLLRKSDARHAQHKTLRKPDPLPALRKQDADAAWTVGWWQGTVTGFMLGLATAVLLGWLR